MSVGPSTMISFSFISPSTKVFTLTMYLTLPYSVISPIDSCAISFPAAYFMPIQLNSSATALGEHPIISDSFGNPKFLLAFFPLEPLDLLFNASLSFAPIAIL